MTEQLESTDFAGFSYPQVGLDDDLLDVIVVDHARQVVDTLIQRHATEINSGSPGMSNLLSAWAEADGDHFDTVWSPAFGDVHALLMSQSKEDAPRAAAALSLRLNERGHLGDWKFQLPTPASFRFGRWLLPQALQGEVRTTSDSVVVRTKANSGWQETAFRSRGGEWQLVIPGSLDALPEIARSGFRFALGNAQALSTSGAERLLSADAYEFDRTEVLATDEWRATLDASLALLQEIDPAYVTWVGRVLRDLIPLKARPQTFNSGSERFSPGVICVSDQCFRWPLAEMLVHESSHQYLHIINRLGPLDDGTDERLYYSPFRQKDRPIFFIVVAYHAFANVLLFYRNARKLGLVPEKVIASEGFAKREETLEKQLAQIEGPLTDATSLTPLGQALWRPVRDALYS